MLTKLQFYVFVHNDFQTKITKSREKKNQHFLSNSDRSKIRFLADDEPKHRGCFVNSIFLINI